MKKFSVLCCLSLLFILIQAQVPQGFSYQALIRSPEGVALSNQSVSIKITLQDALGESVYYSEIHEVITSSLGVATLTIGEGLGEFGIFSEIPWSNESIFLKIEVDATGEKDFVEMGVSKINSVPYTLLAQKALELAKNPNAGENDPLFAVHNSEGKLVFGVYEAGVRIYVDDSATPSNGKDMKSGFAIGGFTGQKEEQIAREFLRVTPDSVRILIREPLQKGDKGGFAIGGYTGQKQTDGNFLFLKPENYFIGHQAGANTVAGEGDEGRYNIFIGFEAGKNNISGRFNTFMGYNTGLNNTGSDNTFIGYQAGYEHQEGGGNVYIGSKAGRNATNGTRNVYIGEKTGQSTTFGRSNVFIGFESGMNLTGNEQDPDKGSYNVFLGYQSGRACDTVFRNVFIGYQAGMNTVADEEIGGSVNVFIGSEAGLSNTTGYGNTAIGEQALKQNTLGNGNVAIGRRPLINNTTGIFNIALGNMALTSNETGKGNVAVGSGALFKLVSNDHNVAVGEGALALALDSANVAVGPYTLAFLKNGINNTAIGKKANVSVLGGTYNNTTAIGYEAIVTSSNQVVIGNSEVTSFVVKGAFNATTANESANLFVASDGSIMRSLVSTVTGSGTANKLAYWNGEGESTLSSVSSLHWDNINGRLGVGESSPDARLHINQPSGSLPIRITKASTSNYWGFGVRVVGTDNDDFVFAYNGTTKGFIDDVSGEYTTASDRRLKSNIEPIGYVLDRVVLLNPSSYFFIGSKGSDKKSLGFIAQDVEDIFPNLVREFVEEDGVTYKGLSYDGFTAISIQAIIDLNAKLEQTISQQEQAINQLRQDVENMKNIINKLMKQP